MFCRQTPKWPRYLLDFGLVLKQNLEQGSRKGGVGQQWDGRGCPQKACRWRKHQSTAAEEVLLPPPPHTIQRFPRVLTLLGSRYHRVKQHLQGGRIVETCEYLQDRGVREEPLAPVHSLEREHKVDMSTSWRRTSGVCSRTMVWAAMRAANMLLPGTPGAQKDTRMLVPPRSLPSVSRRASSAISAVANSNTAKRRKLPS